MLEQKELKVASLTQEVNGLRSQVRSKDRLIFGFKRELSSMVHIGLLKDLEQAVKVRRDLGLCVLFSGWSRWWRRCRRRLSYRVLLVARCLPCAYFIVNMFLVSIVACLYSLPFAGRGADELYQAYGSLTRGTRNPTQQQICHQVQQGAFLRDLPRQNIQPQT